mgnify:CR=1 FL=1
MSLVSGKSLDAFQKIEQYKFGCTQHEKLEQDLEAIHDNTNKFDGIVGIKYANAIMIDLIS